jgi:putative ABC transport system permease protein
MVDLLTGIRHGFRALRTEPGFSAVSIAVLATGIGATTLMFTLVQGVLLRALPFADPEQLVWMYNTRTERDRAPLSLPDYEDYRRESSTLADLALFTNWTTNLTGVGRARACRRCPGVGEFLRALRHDRGTWASAASGG